MSEILGLLALRDTVELVLSGVENMSYVVLLGICGVGNLVTHIDKLT